MNKTQLIEQLKLPEEKVNALLTAAEVKGDLPAYSEEQFQLLKAIAALVESGKAKTYKAAVELYRSSREESKTAVTAKQTPQRQGQAVESAPLVVAATPDLSRINDGASALASIPIEIRAAIEQSIDQSAQKFAAEIPTLTAEEIQRFKDNLRNNIGLGILEMYQQAVIRHMSKPAFIEVFQTALAGGK